MFTMMRTRHKAFRASAKKCSCAIMAVSTLLGQLYLSPALATKPVSDEMRGQAMLMCYKQRVQPFFDEMRRLSCANGGLARNKSKKCKNLAQRAKSAYKYCLSSLKTDGQQCTTNAGCRSGYCAPGPSLAPNQSGPKYCLNRSLHCARAGTAGARYGDTMFFQGNSLTCANPALFGWGRRPAQFMLAKKLVVTTPPGKGPVTPQPAVKRTDGSQCNSASECLSGYCTPGPALHPDGKGAKYCLNRNLNCSLPGSSGARYGQTVLFHGQRLSCSNPAQYGWGRLSAQFMLPVRP